MRKTKFAALLTLTGVLLLSACNAQGSSSSSSSLSSEDSSSEASSDKNSSSEASLTPYSVENSAEGILKAFEKMKAGFNYSIYNNYDSSDFKITEKYYSAIKRSKTTNYVNLPNHKDASRNVAYIVTTPRKGDPYVSSLAYTQDIYGDRYEIEFASFNFASSFVDETKASALQEKDGVYKTEDSGILAPFISFYGTSSIASVSLWVDNGGKDLNFELFSSSGLSLTTGYFYDIGSTRIDSLEKLVDGFSWETTGKALTKEQASTMFDENFSATTDIYLTFNSSSSRIATIDFSCNKDTLYINSVNDPDNGGKRYINYLKARESDDRAMSYGLNAQNEESIEETRYFFSQYTLPSELDINDFRLCGDGQYRYFSLEPGVVYQTYAHVSINDDDCEFSDVTLQLENDKVVSITSTSSFFAAKGSYKAVTTLKSYTGITLPVSYDSDGPAAMVRAMNYFDGAYEHPFKVTKVNSLTNPTSRETYLFDGTTYLIQSETYDSYTASWSKSIKGYTQDSDGQVIAFRQIQGKDKLVQDADIIEGDKITNYFPKLIDPKTTMKNSDGTYSFKELVTECGASLWLAGTTVANTVTMTANSRGLLESVSAQVYYTSSGAEYLSFDYDNITLPEGVDVSNIGPMELTCYADDTPDEWSDLVTYLGEEYANLIPYYYDKKHVGNWYAEPCYSSGTGVPDGGLSYDEAPLIGVSLYCFGSDVETSVLDEGFEKNGFTRVTSGEIDIGYRDDDYLKNGRTTDVYPIDASTQTVWVLEGKLRVIYVNEIPYHHFSSSYNGNTTLGGDSDGVLDQSAVSSDTRSVEYTLHEGILIQKIDGTEINRNGTFH